MTEKQIEKTEPQEEKIQEGAVNEVSAEKIEEIKEEPVEEEHKEEEKKQPEKEKEKSKVEVEKVPEEHQEEYPYPTMKLSEAIKLALDKFLKLKVDAKEKEEIANLLKAAIRKYPVIGSYPKMSTDKQSHELLREAAEEIERLQLENAGIKENLEVSKNVERKYNKMMTERKDAKVNELLKRELSLGLVSEEKEKEMVEVYRKLSEEDLDKMFERMKDLRPVEPKRETHTSEKPEGEKVAEISDEEAKARELMKKAGISEETINEYYKKEE